METDLLNFLFNSAPTGLPKEHPLLIFSIACSITGIFVVSLDLIIVKLSNKPSFLKLSYSGYKTPLIILFWGVGAGLGGYLGAAIDIFELNRAATIFVAITWTTMLPRILESLDSTNSTEKVNGSP